MNHKKIAISSLNKKVLAEIRGNYNLSKCPLCGKQLTDKWKCRIGASRDGSRSATGVKLLCDTCKIIWTFSIYNGTSGHHAYTEKWHLITVYGVWSCECGGHVLEPHLYRFEDIIGHSGSVKGHTMIGKPV